jgi:hypothetical protein
MNPLRTFRFLAIAATLAVAACIGLASPAAKAAPIPAAIAAAGFVWGACLLISPVDRTRFAALSAASSLKLDKVLEFTLKAFKARLVALRAFSHVFQAGEISLDSTIRVPYVPLEGMASQDWDPVLGYGDGDFNIEQKPVQVNRRKYQVLSFTSDQLRGLPLDALNEAMLQKTDKLASDVSADVLSLVTAARFGAAVHSGAATAFDSDDITDIATACTNALWPAVGRSLILDTTFTGNLRKDDSIKSVMNSGSDATLREGIIGRVSGFDVGEQPGFPANGENLKGIATLKYGILVASAPIAPSDEVRAQLSDYRVVTDESGLTLTYRAWGNADFDLAKRLVEFSYGAAEGDTNQIKRVTT